MRELRWRNGKFGNSDRERRRRRREACRTMREGRRTSGKGVNLAGNRIRRPKNRENRQFSGFEPFRAFASDQIATTGQDHPKKRLLPRLCAKLAGRRRGQRPRGAASSRNRGGDVCGRLPPKLRRWPSPGAPIFSTSRYPSTRWEKVCAAFRVPGFAQVAERRKKIAHGASRGLNEQNESSPGWGERDLRWLVFCRPCRGLDGFDNLTHGFTVGYFLPRLRRWGNHLPMLVRKSFSSRAKARA